MASPVDPQQSFPQLEQDVLRRWRERDVFHESLRRRAGAEPWVFYEGPPTANGRPAVHHVLSRVFKDIFPRFKTMCGHRVERKGGWDCHGLPVEIAVERDLGISSKAEIEAYGIAEFNARCREAVFSYLEDWNAMTERIGFWIDLDDAYRTLDPTYVESVWWALKVIAERDLLYEGHKVVPYCPRCGTALSSHEVAQGYQDVVDPSVYVRLPVAEDGGPLQAGDELLVWTTTPWTLVSNAAVAVDPELTYVRAKASTLDAPAVVAEALVERVLGEGAEILARFPGAALDGVRYEPPFGFLRADAYGERGHTVLLGDFVTAEDGTGLVHTAIAFGEDDFRLGQRYGLNVVNPVRLDGTYDERIGPFAGRFVKEADADLVEDLRRRGRLLRAEDVRARLPPLLALRDAAAVLRQAVLVHRDLAAARPASRLQRSGRLASRAHQARALRRLAREQRRLGALARALLGDAAAGLALRPGARPRRRLVRRAGGPLGRRACRTPTARSSTRSPSPAPNATGGWRASPRSSTSGSTRERCPSRSTTRRSSSRSASPRASPPSSSARRWTRRAAGSTRCWPSGPCSSTARRTSTSCASG